MKQSQCVAISATVLNLRLVLEVDVWKRLDSPPVALKVTSKVSARSSPYLFFGPCPKHTSSATRFKHCHTGARRDESHTTFVAVKVTGNVCGRSFPYLFFGQCPKNTSSITRFQRPYRETHRNDSYTTLVALKVTSKVSALCWHMPKTRVILHSYSLILASFGGPKEAQIEPKSLLGPSGEAMFCLTWRLEAS